MIPSKEGYAKRGVGLNAAEKDFCTQLNYKGGTCPLTCVSVIPDLIGNPEMGKSILDSRFPWPTLGQARE